MNRRVRNRTHGGVVGGTPQGSLLPDSLRIVVVRSIHVGVLVVRGMVVSRGIVFATGPPMILAPVFAFAVWRRRAGRTVA